MELYALNPFIRFMDIRLCRYSYKTEVIAYDFRLFCLTEGSCQLVSENETLALCAGDCLIFSPGRRYRFVFCQEQPARMFVVNFDLDFGRTDCPPLTPDAPAHFRAEQLIAPSMPHPFDWLPLHGAQSLEQPLQRLLYEHQQQGPYHQALCSALFKTILIEALRLPLSKAPAHSELVQNILGYLAVHFCDPVDADTLSHQFNYHAYYLGKRFRAETGQSIHQYILRLRVKKCAQLLLYTSLSLGEIAAQCGFSSASYLAEYFKKCYHMTPGQYRETGRLV